MANGIYEFADLTVRDGAPKRRGAARKRRDTRRTSSRRANIGVIYNPRSHRNKGQDLVLGGRENVMVATPEKRSQIIDALSDFASSGIDYLIINGGDGTVRDVLTCGQSVFGDDWPVIAVLPKGKTNALGVDLGAPKDWSLCDAIDAFANNAHVTRRPIEIAPVGSDGAPVRGFIMGAGAFTLGTEAGQDAHSFGLFDSLAVGLTTGWAVLQALFGRDSNPWRRGVAMSLRGLPSGKPVAHSGHGDVRRREIMFASTLCRMPLGIKPFGPEREGLKLALMDKPRRRLMLALPLVLTGWQPKWLASAGVHQVDLEAFEFEIDGRFILDGEAFPAGRYRVSQGPELTFVTA